MVDGRLLESSVDSGQAAGTELQAGPLIAPSQTRRMHAHVPDPCDLMRRGFEAVLTKRDEIVAKPPAEAIRAIGKDLVTKMVWQ